MSKKLVVLDPREFQLDSFGDLVSVKIAIVGEEAGTYEIFRSGLLSSLLPMTPYECVIAENLIAIEWEICQQRRMRDACMREAARIAIEGAMIQQMREENEPERKRRWKEYLSDGGDKPDWNGAESSEKEAAKTAAYELVARAMSDQHEIRAEAYSQIGSMGLDPIDLMSRAYRGSHNH